MKNVISKNSSSDKKAAVQQENSQGLYTLSTCWTNIYNKVYFVWNLISNMRENVVFIFHFTANHTVSSFSWIILHFLYPSIRWSKSIEASVSCPESHTIEPGLALKTSIWLTKALKSIFIKDLLNTKEVLLKYITNNQLQ